MQSSTPAAAAGWTQPHSLSTHICLDGMSHTDEQVSLVKAQPRSLASAQLDKKLQAKMRSLLLRACVIARKIEPAFERQEGRNGRSHLLCVVDMSLY